MSVNQWGNGRAILRADMRELARGGESGTGPWGLRRRSGRSGRTDKIGVVDVPKTIQGVTVHNISHTEAAYLVDGRGYEARALRVSVSVLRMSSTRIDQLASDG